MSPNKLASAFGLRPICFNSGFIIGANPLRWGVIDMPTQVPVLVPTIQAESFEPYVSVERAAQYLDLKPKTLLAQARKGLIPAYPWGEGTRKTWRFKISQLDGWMKSKLNSPRRPPFSERRDFQ